MGDETNSTTRFSEEVFDALVLEANLVDRHRQNQNIHKSYSDPFQRLLNAIGPDSYSRPHRRLSSVKSECLIALRGIFAMFAFSDRGDVVDLIFFPLKNMEVKMAFVPV